MIRLNETAKEFAGNEHLKVRLGFAIPFLEETGTGMPHPDENEMLRGVEDQICAKVSAGASGIHVLTLTNAAMKEMVFYIEEGADIGAIRQQLMDEVSSHEVQCMAVLDPEWEAYASFSPE